MINVKNILIVSLPFLQCVALVLLGDLIGLKPSSWVIYLVPLTVGAVLSIALFPLFDFHKSQDVI